MFTVGDARKHTPWTDFQSSVTPHQARFQHQTTRFRKAVVEIFPTTPCSGPTLLVDVGQSSFENRSRGCVLLSHQRYVVWSALVRCFSGRRETGTLPPSLSRDVMRSCTHAHHRKMVQRKVLGVPAPPRPDPVRKVPGVVAGRPVSKKKKAQPTHPSIHPSTDGHNEPFVTNAHQNKNTRQARKSSANELCPCFSQNGMQTAPSLARSLPMGPKKKQKHHKRQQQQPKSKQRQATVMLFVCKAVIGSQPNHHHTPAQSAHARARASCKQNGPKQASKKPANHLRIS